MSTVTFKVTGMYCGSCSMLVTLSLEKLPGVTSVECDPSSGNTVVTFDDSLATVASLYDAVIRAGYGAEPLACDGESAEGKRHHARHEWSTQMKAAVHIRTAGFYCGACPKVVEKALGATDGVLDVVAVRSLGLTSVLFDSDRIDRQALCERIRKSGFSAEIIGSGASAPALDDFAAVEDRGGDRE